MSLISEKDAEYLRKEFETNLVEPVKLVMFTQEMECQFCAETRQIVEEIAELSDKIAVEIYDFVADKGRQSCTGLTRSRLLPLCRWRMGRKRTMGFASMGSPRATSSPA